MLGEILPNLFIDRFSARELVQCLAQFLAPGSIGLLTPGEADDAKIRRHLLFFVKMVKSGYELARGQVPAGAENDDGAGRHRFALLTQTASGEVVGCSSLVHARRMDDP